MRNKYTARFASKAVGCVLSSCILSSSAVAAAQTRDVDDDSSSDLGGMRVGLDLDFAANGSEDGVGGALRLGQEYDLVLISLTPELMGSLHNFSDGADPTTQYSALAGGRATIGKLIEAGVFAHVGVGHAAVPVDPFTGLALDLGLTLDLTLIPGVDLGVHGAYDSIAAGEDSLDWYRLGAHIVFAP